MERINLTKYGFVRWPEEDFNDDGARFTCYKAGKRIRVSKTTYRDEVFISARLAGPGLLDYDEYSKLPHYKDLDKLNGIDKDKITEQDLIELFRNCIEYERAYEALEAQCTVPSIQEIQDYLDEVKQIRIKEYDEIKGLLAAKVDKLVLNLGAYDWKQITERFRDLYRATQVDTADSAMGRRAYPGPARKLLKDKSELKPSWYYTSIKEYISKA